ncbi:MAG: nicotinamide-nucleotide adenylyltransferase [Candidatus Altiarchaeales archaeon]|nr:nicotinamide-nucleotide adenylyltransferase [Candidatus Altiarchaeales archaeon]
MRGFVLGRFQPLHNGHLKMMEWVAQRVDELIIGLGSCNKSHVFENPFTKDERHRMIKEALDIKPAYSIVDLPDVGDDKLWVRNILDNVEFDVFYTNAVCERNLLQKKVEVEEIPFFDRHIWCATNIRENIVEGLEWRNLVPPQVQKIIDEIQGVARLKRLQRKPSA